MSGHGEACLTMHGQNPSRASGKPADRTERERSHSIVIASSAVIDGRADERECRAACVSAKAVARKENEGDAFQGAPRCVGGGMSGRNVR